MRAGRIIHQFVTSSDWGGMGVTSVGKGRGDQTQRWNRTHSRLGKYDGGVDTEKTLRASKQNRESGSQYRCRWGGRGGMGGIKEKRTYSWAGRVRKERVEGTRGERKFNGSRISKRGGTLKDVLMGESRTVSMSREHLLQRDATKKRPPSQKNKTIGIIRTPNPR